MINTVSVEYKVTCIYTRVLMNQLHFYLGQVLLSVIGHC